VLLIIFEISILKYLIALILKTNTNFIWLRKKSKPAVIKTKPTSASVEDFINSVVGGY
jgi:hypothetical protein